MRIVWGSDIVREQSSYFNALVRMLSQDTNYYVAM